MSRDIFLVDTSVFVQAYRSYYPFDVFPCLWQFFVDKLKENRIQSIDRVKEELLINKDELAQWAKDSFLKAFQPSGERQVLEKYKLIIEWSQSQKRFKDSAKSEFASNADGWLVAYAWAGNLVLATQEVSAPESRTGIKIPDVCKAFHVKTVNTIEMLRCLQARWQ